MPRQSYGTYELTFQIVVEHLRVHSGSVNQRYTTNLFNTSIGDPELIEIRFPALFREFSIRRGTG
jgi:N-methylhydantoinase B/oxoprolinase/acetone carboxylase alpha subunit